MGDRLFAWLLDGHITFCMALGSLVFAVIAERLWAREGTVCTSLQAPSPRMGLGRALSHIHPRHGVPQLLSPAPSMLGLGQCLPARPSSEERRHNRVQTRESPPHRETTPGHPSCAGWAFRGESDRPSLQSSQSDAESSVVSTWAGALREAQRRPLAAGEGGGPRTPAQGPSLPSLPLPRALG